MHSLTTLNSNSSRFQSDLIAAWRIKQGMSLSYSAAFKDSAASFVAPRICVLVLCCLICQFYCTLWSPQLLWVSISQHARTHTHAHTRARTHAQRQTWGSRELECVCVLMSYHLSIVSSREVAVTVGSFKVDGPGTRRAGVGYQPTKTWWSIGIHFTVQFS